MSLLAEYKNTVAGSMIISIVITM